MITAAVAPVIASSDRTAAYVTVCALLAVFAIGAVLYQHERRADRHETVTNEHDEQLGLLAGRIQALAEWLGVEITDPVEDDSPEAMAAEEPPLPDGFGEWPEGIEEFAAEVDPKTDEIPIALPETEPMAVVNPTPAVQARRDAAWDETRPSPVPRTDSDEAKARKAAWVEAELAKIRERIDAAQEAS